MFQAIRHFCRVIMAFDRILAGRNLMESMEGIAFHPEVLDALPEVGQQYTDWMKQGIAIMKPVVKDGNLGYSFLEQWDDDEPVDDIRVESSATRPLLLLPIFEKDRKPANILDGYTLKNSLAVYSQTSNLLIVNMEYETIQFLALGCLHEIHHATLAKKEGRTFADTLRSETEILQEEVNVWSLDAKLVGAIAGQRYRHAVEQRAEDIKKWYDNNATILQPSQDKASLFDKFFGPTPDTRAIAQRNFKFDFYSHFFAIDQLFSSCPDAQVREKIRIYKDCHKNFLTSIAAEQTALAT